MNTCTLSRLALALSALALASCNQDPATAPHLGWSPRRSGGHGVVRHDLIGPRAARRRKAEQIAAGWEEDLRPIEAVHHQAGNYRVAVQGDQATAFCYAIASHYRKTRSGRNTRAFVGSYDFHLAQIGGRWRIDSFRFNLKYVDGNAELERDG